HIDGIGKVDINLLEGDKTLGWYINNVQEIQSPKQNIIQTGAFSPYEVPDAMGALKSLNMKGTFHMQEEGLAYIVTDPTSDKQLQAFKEYLGRKNWWYKDK
ncbi:N-acetylmuramoyl-L-alanine amidase C-terminal domain-containing protein, partial [Bacillus tropicus]|uniref:N-acetylmuramoyl-L-alanine amidase C-terminal domain-containing protein n=1 Tax=Bacillus tropicus TaxID=2026188 RepID=UPI002E236679|nr:N-acetylmuramoyl-L-alanine amidase C-terminal domain-containing protein [Bacillus tropicus]